MRAGALRHQITIQRRVQVGTTSLNEPNFVWQDWRTPFADLEVRRGREHFDIGSRQRFSEEVWRFRTRYEEVVGLDTTMRVVHGGNNFDIKAVLPEGQFQRTCVIECTVQGVVLGEAPLAIAITSSIPGGTVGVAYGGFTVAASGGESPYIFSEESGTLPPGLSLNTSSGAVTGTPTTAGSYTQSIQVSDAAGTFVSLPSFTITIS